MKLLIVRHATAVRSDTPDLADEDRALTSRGRKQFKKAAKGLAEIMAPPDLLLTSPLLRARETAKIAGKVWKVEPTEEPLLSGGTPEALLAAVATHPEEFVIALVGHEPDLGRLLAHVIGGVGERLPFKRGGAALVELEVGEGGGARLVWFMPPKLLRALRG